MGDIKKTMLNQPSSAQSNYKIAFLALDDIHHIHHVAPIAFELSQNVQYQCVIYIQNHGLSLVNKIASLYPNHRCQIRVVSPSIFRKVMRLWRKGICSARRLIQQQSRELLTYDALVTPDLNLGNLINQTRQLKKRPLFFLTFHGGGNRPRPHYLLTDYDFIFLYSEQRLQQFQQAGYLSKTDYAVTGYPKFDVIQADFKPKLFANHKPIVLYNPHFDLKISSWSQWGLAILEYFYQNRQYNLIFAPHCHLFRQYLSIKKIPAKYFSAPNIIIDIGSEKSVDMTYTQAADLYLGDVSSQVFEFIRRPRPCLFLNSNQLKKENYLTWNLGTVINDFNDFPAALTQSFTNNSYQSLQQKYFAETFSLSEQSSASRAAQAIHQKMQKHPCILDV